MTPSQLTCAAFWLLIFAIVLRFVAGNGHFALGQPVSVGTWLTWLIFSIFFLLCGTAHLIQAARRQVMREHEFSYSDGEPWDLLMKVAPFVRDAWDFEMFFEPAVCIDLGALLLSFRNWFGLYLIICGVAIYQRASTKHDTRRALDLDLMDGRFQATNQPHFEHDKEKPSLSPIKAFDKDTQGNGEDR